MPRGKNPTLTEAAAFGLFFIQRYRFLTIDQFARIASLNRSTASGQLRILERQGFDINRLGTNELMSIVENILDRLSVQALMQVRNLAETKRMEKLDDAKNG
jgi:hypothetical protein